ncbi:transposase [Enterococcus faecium]|nr:transposase [Enterococcus faecium]
MLRITDEHLDLTNHIKTLKRVSYGFNSFTNMRIRIFLINGLIKIK